MASNIPSQHEYEMREAREFNRQLDEVERGSLAERKEAAASFYEAMAHDPGLVAERVGWLLNGSYGYGSYKAAMDVARRPRMNRAALLTQWTGALEWMSPMRMTIASWKKLTPAQKKHLDAAVMREIELHLQEHK